MGSERTDRHTALASTPLGRAFIAVIFVVGALWLAGPNMPAGPVRTGIDTLWSPAREIGLVQDWGVFSPNPRSQSLDVRARIEFDDGTVEFWDAPEFGPVVGAYRQYRWNKWQERVRLDGRRELWEPTAQWLADLHRRGARRPERVTLIRRWIDHEPLDDRGMVDSDWNEFEFHVWEHET